MYSVLLIMKTLLLHQSSFVYIRVHVCSQTEITVHDWWIYVCIDSRVRVACDITCVFVLM